jgi:hypothetical protein
MKSCDYCGHENQDTVAYCLDCGTEFRQAADPTPPAPDLSGLKGYFRYALMFGGTIFAIVSLYLLSLGPVVRYCGTWKTFPAPTNTSSAAVAYTSSAGATVVTPVRTVAVSYPGWVGIVYDPVFPLGYGGGQVGGLRLLYHQYLVWWAPANAAP